VSVDTNGDLFGSRDIQFIPRVTLFMMAALSWWMGKWKPKWANCTPKWVNWNWELYGWKPHCNSA